MPHLHLDPVGGVAGDMFAGALLHLAQHHGLSFADGLVAALRGAGLADDVDVRVVAHKDEVFAGVRFVVDDPRERARPLPGRFVLQRGDRAHAHVPLADIRARVEASTLSPGAKARAHDIFLRIGTAEAAVHGLPVDEIAFHEVGAQDSVADVVAAAYLVDQLEQALGPVTASTASLPLGSGRITTAHGLLPVPAPATLRLLEGLPVHDDQRVGERVTPTGAAIVQHLLGGRGAGTRPAGVVVGHGVGFGTKVWPGLSNILRVTLTTPTATTPATMQARPLVEISCEIDDMTAEELAVSLEHLRRLPVVRDVHTVAVVMKKGRAATRVVALVDAAVHDASDADAVDVVCAAFFDQTTTLGVRVARVERRELARTVAERVVDGDTVRRKTAQRPGGPTHKVDVDDVTGATLSVRRARRHEGER